MGNDASVAPGREARRDSDAQRPVGVEVLVSIEDAVSGWFVCNDDGVRVGKRTLYRYLGNGLLEGAEKDDESGVWKIPASVLDLHFDRLIDGITEPIVGDDVGASGSLSVDEARGLSSMLMGRVDDLVVRVSLAEDRLEEAFGGAWPDRRVLEGEVAHISADRDRLAAQAVKAESRVEGLTAELARRDAALAAAFAGSAELRVELAHVGTTLRHVELERDRLRSDLGDVTAEAVELRRLLQGPWWRRRRGVF